MTPFISCKFDKACLPSACEGHTRVLDVGKQQLHPFCNTIFILSVSIILFTKRRYVSLLIETSVYKGAQICIRSNWAICIIDFTCLRGHRELGIWARNYFI